MYDSKKENPTGFSKEDIKYDLYGMCAALLFNDNLLKKHYKVLIKVPFLLIYVI